jgi:hypothetical protein
MRPLRAAVHSSSEPESQQRGRAVYRSRMSVLSWLSDRLFGDGSAREGEPERLPSPDEVVFLTHAGGEPEALMLRELLGGNDIVALAKNRSVLSAHSPGGGLLGGWELWVLRRDLRRARDLLGIGDE